MEPDLHSDVEPRYVEGLEHDLGSVLSVFWCVQWRLRLQTQDVVQLDSSLDLTVKLCRSKTLTQIYKYSNIFTAEH